MTARLTPKQIREQQDWAGVLNAGNDGYAVVYDHDTGKFVMGAFEPLGQSAIAAAAAVAAHVALSNPHSQYYLASGVSGFGATLASAADAAAARTTLGLGTAAVGNVGTGANQIVQLDGSARLPAVDGSQLTGVVAAASPGGSTTQVQYNNAGAFAGDAGLTYNASTDRLTVAGGLIAPSMRPASDSTTALQLQNAAGTAVVTVDTTNSRISIEKSGSPRPRINLIDPGGQGQGYLDFYTYAGQTVPTVRWAGEDVNSYNGDHAFYCSTGGSANQPLLEVFRINKNYVRVKNNLANGISIIAWNNGSESGSSGLGLSVQNNGVAKAAVMAIGNGASWGVCDIAFCINTTASSAVVSKSDEKMRFTRLGYLGIGVTDPGSILDLAASTTTRASLRVRAGTAPTTPNDGDVWYATGGRLNVYRAATETIASGVPGTGGSATATGTWGATEQAMLQAVYDIARSFGMLS